MHCFYKWPLNPGERFIVTVSTVSGKVHTYAAGAEELETVEATLQDNGKVAVVLVGKSGKRTPIETDVPVVITDAGGQQWRVDKEGNVTKRGAGAGSTPDGTTETNSVPAVQKELIKELLEYYKKEIAEACNGAFANLELVETQVTSLQSIVTEYEEGMLRKYFVPEELTALKEYLRVVAEQIEDNRANINELKEYIALNNVEQLYQDFLNYLNELLKDEEKQGSFSKMDKLNDLNNHIITVYEGFKSCDSSLGSYKKYLEKIKEKVNQASSATGKKLMEQGFFNLRSDFIKDWFAIDYSFWGGLYKTRHDFMHIEVLNNYKQKALDRLHEEDIEFYKNFFKENYPEEYSVMFNE